MIRFLFIWTVISVSSLYLMFVLPVVIAEIIANVKASLRRGHE